MTDPTQNPSPAQRPGMLCILDGWGWRPDIADNAIATASLAGLTPHFDRMLADSPRALLDTAGRAVGLPDGQMGNSEVGHMNIGAGRVMLQDLPRIDDAVQDGTLAQNLLLRDLLDKVKQTGGAVHLMGLMSPGGVHSHQDHIAALAKIIAAQGVRVMIHAFLDGRDTPPKSAQSYLSAFDQAVSDQPLIQLATICGRYYAMDRDKRWDRVAKASAMITQAEGAQFSTWQEALDASYASGLSDEFVLPCILGGYTGAADGDALLFANFRADRAREISTILLDPHFTATPRQKIVAFCAAAGLTEYSDALKPLMTALFPSENVQQTLGEAISNHGLRQLRIAETEKYAHVTFFLNGGREDPFPGEDRILVPSPNVATYDLKPEMSAFDVTAQLEDAIASNSYDLIVVNFANPDMVGHTGFMDAAIKAVAAIDQCLGRLRAAMEKAGGVMLICADHGNVELMRDQSTGEPHTAHTIGEVPVIVVNARQKLHLHNGVLADVAPTMLDLMGLPRPAQMSGQSLLQTSAAQHAVEKVA